MALGTEMPMLGEVYAEAARIMQRRGKAVGTYGVKGGAVCALGAVGLVTTGCLSDYTDGVVRPLGRLLGSELLPLGKTIDFSDYHNKKEVVDFLNLAAWVYDDTPNPLYKKVEG